MAVHSEEWEDGEMRHELNIYEGYSNTSLLVDELHDSLEKQDKYDYNKQGVTINASQTENLMYNREENYHIPHWMCKKIHDWYEDNK